MANWVIFVRGTDERHDSPTDVGVDLAAAEFVNKLRGLVGRESIEVNFPENAVENPLEKPEGLRFQCVVNGETTVLPAIVDYEDLVRLAEKQGQPTITYRRVPIGISTVLYPGQRVEVRQGTIFDVIGRNV